MKKKIDIVIIKEMKPKKEVALKGKAAKAAKKY